MKRAKLILGVLLASSSFSIFAHDPVFGIGPHVLFKGGSDFALKTNTGQAGEKTASGVGVELVYGITGDWAAGLELPYAYKKDAAETANGVADVRLFTKYRFWRKDSFGAQDSAAILLAANLNNGDDNANPKLGNGANDFIGGLTYGFESLEWYRWASIRYRYNGENNARFQLGNKTLVDFVLGWRPTLPEYKKPDTVWLLELNSEFSEKSKSVDDDLANSGGIESFISPGIFWTYRNFAIKAGIQIPIYSNLNGVQEKYDFRAKSSLEWHF